MAIADWYNQDQIAGLEALYGEGATGKPSDARHISAMSNLSDTFAGKTRAEALGLGTPNKLNQFIGDTGAFGAGLINEIPGVYRSIKGQAPVGDVWEDIKANWKGTYGTPYGTSSEDIYKEVYAPDETPTLALDRNRLPRPAHLGFNYNYDTNSMDRFGNTVAPNIPMDRFGNTVAPNIPMGEDTSDLSGIAEVREPTQINNTYQTYMHPYDDVDRWTADEDMTYQPDVQSNRFSGLTNPVKRGAGMLMSGLTKIPGAGLFLDAIKPASPELRAQADAVTAADKNNLMAGKNMISMFGTNDPEQMILDRINRIKTRKADQTEFSRNRIIELERLADEANRAKHSASADLGGGWTRQNRPGGAATFTGPGGQTHQGWSNTAAGTRAAAESEGSFARGGYTRSRYNTGGRVGILAAF